MLLLFVEVDCCMLCWWSLILRICKIELDVFYFRVCYVLLVGFRREFVLLRFLWVLLYLVWLACLVS